MTEAARYSGISTRFTLGRDLAFFKFLKCLSLIFHEYITKWGKMFYHLLLNAFQNLLIYSISFLMVCHVDILVFCLLCNFRTFLGQRGMYFYLHILSLQTWHMYALQFCVEFVFKVINYIYFLVEYFSFEVLSFADVKEN